MDAPGRLLASGRDSDIFEVGEGRVLRRARDGRSLAGEARVMSYVQSKGYPLPEVFDVSEGSITMERVDGPSMLADLEQKPWRLAHHAAVLAELHKRLHEIPAPDWLPAAPGSQGSRLLHLDLHPLNVIMSPKGPIVIDWPNAKRGNPPADVAATWILLAGGKPPTNGWTSIVVDRFRGVFVRSFLRHFVMAPVRAELEDIVEWKCHDAHMAADELEVMRDLARRHGRK